MADTIERFSNRVNDYAKYRPGYPAEILSLLKSSCGLTSNSIIADVGSGTGKLTELFLQNGNFVYAVEPNPPMRASAEDLLSAHQRFKSVDGRAEATSLPRASVDFITAGQAFHWFDRLAARVEFSRILKPGGWVVIVWNQRRLDSTPFLRGYEELLLKYGTDYQKVRHENVAPEVSRFFSPAPVAERTVANFQEFDLEGLKGRIASTSYTPQRGTEAFTSMLDALENLFAKYAMADRVVLEYDTRVYFGRLPEQSRWKATASI